MSIKTLKNAKVGDKVTMVTFTGMNLGQFEITKAGKTKLAIQKKDGTQAEFSRETGVQLNANNPKFANSIIDPIPEPEKKVPVAAKKSDAEKPAKEGKKDNKKNEEKKAPAKPAKKIEKVEIEEDAEDWDDEEDLEDDFEEFED